MIISSIVRVSTGEYKKVEEDVLEDEDLILMDGGVWRLRRRTAPRHRIHY